MAKQKLRKYELIYIVQPEATEEDREKVRERVGQALELFDARVIKQEDWGKRKLAYEIRKFSKGYFQYMVILSRPGVTQEVERVLRMLDNCIRFLTIKLDEGIDPDSPIVVDDEPAVRPGRMTDDDFMDEDDDDA